MFRFQKIFVTLLFGIICKTSAQQTAPRDSRRFINVSPIQTSGRAVRFIEDNKDHLVIVSTGKTGFVGLVNNKVIDPLVKGYIADAELGTDGNIWYIGQNQIGSVDFSKKMSKKNLNALFFDNNKPNSFTSSDHPLFYRDRLGSIWLDNAPNRVGIEMKSLPNPQSETTVNKFPVPMSTDPFGNMWGLVSKDDKGLKAIGVIISGKPQKWTVFDNSNGFPVGQWKTVVADPEGMIWVSGKAGLCYFDPRKSKAGWRTFTIPGKNPDEAVQTMTLSSKGFPLISLQNGDLLEVNVDAQDVPIVKSIGTEGLPKLTLDAIYTDRAGLLWVVVKNQLYREDKQPSEWKSLTSMPYGNHDVFSVELNGKIYIPGGGANHSLPATSFNFDRMMIYDTQNDRWELSPPMLINHRYCSVGLLEGKIWVIGGFHKTTLSETRTWVDSPTDTVEIYDPVSHTWSLGPRLDKPRAETVTCSMAGRIYVFGSTGKVSFNTLSIGPGENEWRIEPEAPYPIYQTNGTVLDDKAYIMAGGVGLIMYDPATKTWQKDLPQVPGSKAPWSCAMASFKGKIWAISGRNTDDPTKVFIYSPAEKSWSNGPSFPYAASWVDGIAVNGSLYVFGGATQSRIHKTYVYWDAIRVLK